MISSFVINYFTFIVPHKNIDQHKKEWIKENQKEYYTAKNVFSIKFSYVVGYLHVLQTDLIARFWVKSQPDDLELTWGYLQVLLAELQPNRFYFSFLRNVPILFFSYFLL